MTSGNKFQGIKEEEKQVTVVFLVSDREFSLKPKDVTLSYRKQSLHITCTQNVLKRTNLLAYNYSSPKSFPLVSHSCQQMLIQPQISIAFLFSSTNHPSSPPSILLSVLFCLESLFCLSLNICNPLLLPYHSFVSLCALNSTE